MQNQPYDIAQLMGNGSDGSLMSQAHDPTVIQKFEDAALDLHRRIGTLIQDALHVAVALGRAATLVLFRRLLLPRTPSHPRRQLLFTRKAGRLGAYFRDDLLGRIYPESRHLRQPLHLILMGPQQTGHLLFQLPLAAPAGPTPPAPSAAAADTRDSVRPWPLGHRTTAPRWPANVCPPSRPEPPDPSLLRPSLSTYDAHWPPTDRKPGSITSDELLPAGPPAGSVIAPGYGSTAACAASPFATSAASARAQSSTPTPGRPAVSPAARRLGNLSSARAAHGWSGLGPSAELLLAHSPPPQADIRASKIALDIPTPASSIGPWIPSPPLPPLAPAANYTAAAALLACSQIEPARTRIHPFQRRPLPPPTSSYVRRCPLSYKACLVLLGGAESMPRLH